MNPTMVVKPYVPGQNSNLSCGSGTASSTSNALFELIANNDEQLTSRRIVSWVRRAGRHETRECGLHLPHAGLTKSHIG